MKKVLLGMCVVATQLVFAQQLISFETSEGYTAGNIDGQQGWTTTGTGAGQPNILSTVVSTEQAVHGTSSMKIAEDPLFGPQTNGPVIGGFYSLTTPASATNFTVSFDVRMTEQDSNSSDFLFRGINLVGTTGDIVYYIRFRFNGAISVATIATGATTPSIVPTTATWAVNTWYRVKVVGSATDIKYYVNDNLIYTATHLIASPTILNRVDFIHDNYGGDGYVDRIAINNEAALSTSEIVKRTESISIYPNPTSDILNIGTKEKVQSASIFDMSGRKIEAKVMDNAVDVTNLERGIYIINIQTEKGTTSEKFIKK